MKPPFATVSESLQNVKMLAQARHLLARLNLDHVPITDAVRQVRSRRIERTGLRQYIYEMLRPVARRPAKECALLNGNGGVTPLGGDGTLAEYLEQHYTPETLPTVVFVFLDGRFREFVL